VCQALRLQLLLPGHDIALETGGDAVVAVGSQVERLEAREVQRDLLGQGYDNDSIKIGPFNPLVALLHLKHLSFDLIRFAF